jgi:hypothetical protein
VARKCFGLAEFGKLRQNMRRSASSTMPHEEQRGNCKSKKGIMLKKEKSGYMRICRMYIRKNTW